MAVSSLKSRPSFIWIPPASTAAWKLTVSGEDITNNIKSVNIKDGVTDIVGDFSFMIFDPNEEYKSKWTGNEVVKYYSDYGATATTLRFSGVIESPSNQGNKILVKGRSLSAILFNTFVTKEYENASTDSILNSLIDTYGNGLFTATNVGTSTTHLTVTWFEKPFWECVQELCSSANFDCYVDADNDFNYFEVGSRSNTTEGMIHSYNLYSTNDFYPDLTQVRNKIKVYGANQEGTQIIHTSEDLTSQGLYNIREDYIRDENITTQAQAKQVGVAQLAQKKDPPQIGVMEGALLATIQPGEKIYASDPQNGIDPALYDILSYEHKIDYAGSIRTIINLNKEPRRISTVFKDIVNSQTRLATTPINPFQKKFSSNDLFKVDSGSHGSTEISEGVLRNQAGQPNGVWTSDNVTAETNVASAFLIITGELLSGATVEVSNNSGVNYKDITNGESIAFTENGSILKIKITITDENTRVYSYSILYS